MANRIIKATRYFIALALGATILAGGPPEARGVPRRGGTFFQRFRLPPKTLHPLRSFDSYAARAQRYVMESLLDQDLETGKWVGSLAKSWGVSKDGLEYTFFLREGVLWHDGRSLTEEDVVFSFQAIVDPQNRYDSAHRRPYLEHIDSVEVPAPGVVKFRARRKYFLNLQALGTMMIVPKHVYEIAPGKEKVGPGVLVGTGPYIVKSYRREKSLVLKSNPSWWGRTGVRTGRWHLFDKVVIRFIDDPIVALSRLERGDLDFLYLRPEDYALKAQGGKWGREIVKVKARNRQIGGYDYIGWNIKNPLFASRDTRRAMAHLFNRREMIQKFRHGHALLATGPRHLYSDYADPSVRPLEFDPSLALKLLKKEGWALDPGRRVLSRGTGAQRREFSFSILASSDRNMMKYLTLFQQEAQKVGVRVKIQMTDWSTLLTLVGEKKFDAVVLAWPGTRTDEWDPKGVWHSSSIGEKGGNFISYQNPEVDRLIDQAQETLERGPRVEILRRAYRLIADDAPYLFLFNRKDLLYAHRHRIQMDRKTYPYGLGQRTWWADFDAPRP